MFKRKNSERLHRSSTEEIDTSHFETTPSMLTDFFEQHGNEIVASASQWKSIRTRTNDFFEEDAVKESFLTGVADCQGLYGTSRSVESEAGRLLSTFPAYTIAAVRYDARDWRKPMKVNQAYNRLTSLYVGKGVDYILKQKNFPRSKYATLCVDLSVDMNIADELSNHTLRALSQDFLEAPGDVTSLLEIYENDGEAVMPLLSELRQMIAADWQRSEKEESVLRSHVEQVAGNPAAYVTQFCESVARDRQTAPVVHSMASYALALAGKIDPEPRDIARQLKDSRAVWQDVPDLQEAFNRFAQTAARDLVEMFDKLSVRSDVAGRLKPTEADLLTRGSNELAVYAAESREVRRSEKRSRQLYDQEYRSSADRRKHAVQESRQEIELDDGLRSIAFVKQMQGRPIKIVSAGEVSLETLREQFNLHDAVSSDMLRAVEHLRSPQQYHTGVKRLQNQQLSADGKKHALWRFAPDKEVGFKIDPAYRFYRIVYTIVDKKLVVVDILPHDEFDKRY